MILDVRGSGLVVGLIWIGGRIVDFTSEMLDLWIVGAAMPETGIAAVGIGEGHFADSGLVHASPSGDVAG